MASIDKIYATKKQRDEIYSWCEENYKEALPFFYEWYEEWDWEEENEQFPITNFPEEIDTYLLYNCPIKWVTDYIKDQYGKGE